MTCVRTTLNRGAQRWVCVFPLLVCFALIPFSLQADWINLTGAETAPNIAEISIFEDGVGVTLEVYIGDLSTFEELVPDDWLKDSDRERPAMEERLRRFCDGGLQSVGRARAACVLALT